jgi:hypothetical protein
MKTPKKEDLLLLCRDVPKEEVRRLKEDLIKLVRRRLKDSHGVVVTGSSGRLGVGTAGHNQQKLRRGK